MIYKGYKIEKIKSGVYEDCYRVYTPNGIAWGDMFANLKTAKTLINAAISETALIKASQG